MQIVAVFALGLATGFWLRRWLRPEMKRQPPPLPPPDPLTEIVGIGPVFERALQAIGIVTFAQLARQDADALSIRLGKRVSAERIRRERWIEQAKARAGR